MTDAAKPNGVMVAMSGGVDSAVAAYLISREHPCAGVTMRVLNEKTGGADSAERDIRGAATVCNTLGIPHFTAELAEDFHRCVIDPFIAAYQAGETPNPCIFCNKAIKFGSLLHFTLQNGYGGLATGHYVKTERTAEGRTLLRRAQDVGKDQTYMLWSLTQDVLQRCFFPLGDLSKSQARELAAELNFPMATQKDSQDICFVPDGDYAAFIARMTGESPQPGDFIDKNGCILGRHKGQHHYTVGQRKGLGIALGRPAFVTAKSASENTVTLRRPGSFLHAPSRQGHQSDPV